MTNRDALQAGKPTRSRSELFLTQFVIALSVVMMVFGLRQWAVILGIVPGPAGAFTEMPMAWAIITVHFAVVDVVVAVGLWNQAAWGKVLWVYSALFEIVIHTLFTATFGTDWPVVSFHLFTLAVFALLTFLAGRKSAS